MRACLLRQLLRTGRLRGKLLLLRWRRRCHLGLLVRALRSSSVASAGGIGRAVAVRVVRWDGRSLIEAMCGPRTSTGSRVWCSGTAVTANAMGVHHVLLLGVLRVLMTVAGARRALVDALGLSHGSRRFLQTPPNAQKLQMKH